MPNIKHFPQYVHKNELSKVEPLNSKAICDFTDQTYNNAVLYICRYGTVDMLKLVRCKLSPKDFLNLLTNTDFSLGRTALILAVLANNSEMVRYLLITLKVNINEAETPDYDDEIAYTAIDYAAEYNYAPLFQLLYTQRANVTIQTWNILFDTKKLLQQYFIPLRFLENIRDNHRRIVQLFTEYLRILLLKNKSINNFLKCKNAQKQHGILLAAKINNVGIVNLLKEFNFSLHDLDISGKTVFSYLMDNNHKDLASNLMGNIAYSNKTARRNVSNSLSKAIGGPDAGRLPVAFPNEEPRKYHTFSGKRTRQILRHVATQIFFFLRTQTADIKEVQILYLYYKGHDYLFVAGNQIDAFSFYPTSNSTTSL